MNLKKQDKVFKAILLESDISYEFPMIIQAENTKTNEILIIGGIKGGTRNKKDCDLMKIIFKFSSKSGNPIKAKIVPYSLEKPIKF